MIISALKLGPGMDHYVAIGAGDISGERYSCTTVPIFELWLFWRCLACTKSENPTHGSGWMRSGPFYVKALSRRSRNLHTAVWGWFKATLFYVRQDENRSKVAEKQMNSSDLNDPHTAVWGILCVLVLAFCRHDLNASTHCRGWDLRFLWKADAAVTSWLKPLSERKETVGSD